MQIAYTANRGTVSCNLITLEHVELCEEPSLQNQQDLKKAFYRCDRETVVNEAQRKYDAGKLIKYWFKNRTYTHVSNFETQIRGQEHNCGVPAGTLIGVECFMLFIATATKLTGKNIKLLWAALYADDTSPLVRASDMVEFQAALDWAMRWAKQNGCEFHLHGEKGPTFTAYPKKGHEYPQEFDSLHLGKVKIKRNDETVVLGLFRRVRPIHCNIAESACKDHSHDKHIDKYGYECGWNLTKLKQIAYRLQHIKYRLIPEFTRKLVSAYFCGVLRYSASILWCRSSDKNIKQARYCITAWLCRQRWA